MVDYYLSAAGADGNSGSATAPWRSLTRLNAAFASGAIKLGDRVLLRRGDVFPGRLRQPDMLDPTRTGWLRISAYGDGAAPVIDGYKYIVSWTQHSADVWKVHYKSSSAGVSYRGYDSAQGEGDVGHLLVDGAVRGVRRTALSGMTTQWDFYSSGGLVYVKSSRNPSVLAGQVAIAVDGDGSNQRSGVWLSDVVLRGHGGHGVAAPGSGGTRRSNITGCEIYNCGGSALDGYGNGNVRYGNGIQAWVDSRDMLIEGNRVHDCYDVAITLQGGEPGRTQVLSDIVIRLNTTYRCSQGLEFWYGGEGPGFVRCLVERNHVLFSGYGWGGTVRPEQESRVHLLTFGWGTTADLVLRQNGFYDAFAAYRYSSEKPYGLRGVGNVIAMKAGVRMSYQRTETIGQATAWAMADGHETSMKAVILPTGGGYGDANVTAAITHLTQLGI